MDSKIKGKNILLIGGTGFIGLQLAKRLSEFPCNITILDKNIDEAKKLDFTKKIRFIKGDVTNYKSIEENIKNKDIIFNLATVVQDDGNFDPYFDLDINCKGQLNVLEARKNVNPNSKYIFLSSRTQFGILRKEDLPLTEEHCQRPISLYAIHKQTAENYCKLYKRAFDLKSVILRISIAYGPKIIGENKNNIIDKFIKKAINNEKFYVYGYGKNIKDLIYIEDLVELIIKILDSEEKEGIFNVGSGEKIELIDIAKKIVELCGSGNLEAIPFPKEIVKFELGNFYFDISKVKKTFDWEPKTKIEEGLKNTINFYKNQRTEK